MVTDDDNDGSTDEDCAVRNAVIGEGDVTVFVSETARLKWTVYAIDFINFKGLKLYKQQVSRLSFIHMGTVFETRANFIKF